jgi:hypothetical protein
VRVESSPQPEPTEDPAPVSGDVVRTVRPAPDAAQACIDSFFDGIEPAFALDSAPRRTPRAA